MTILFKLGKLWAKSRIQGIRWVAKRIKKELTTPTTNPTTHLSEAAERMRNLLKPRANIANKIHPDNILVTIYDLNSSPATFDFAYFLALAEAFANSNGRSKLFVYFIRSVEGATGDDEYKRTMDENAQSWRLNHILIPILFCYPVCVGHSVISRSDFLLTPESTELVFPRYYSQTHRPPINYSVIFKTLNSHNFSGTVATQQALRYLSSWLREMKITKPIVCITLRQSQYDTARNSNLQAWGDFAKWVSTKGYTPVIIPDTDTCWDAGRNLEEHLTFKEACLNLELRMALYEISFLNFFYSNGCSALATLSKKARYILMLPRIDGSLHARRDSYEAYGWSTIPRRFNFGNRNQLISPKIDTYHNIVTEFICFEQLSHLP